jgi:peptide/nickel transport system permease protein
MAASVAETAPLAERRARGPFVVVLQRALRLRRTQFGIALLLVLLGIAFIGPYFAPASPTDFTGSPFGTSSASAFGTDGLGRDVLSRFLWGGRSVFALTTIATGLAVILGTAIGLIAAYSRNLLDDVLMRSMDVILSFPSIILALVAVATFGPRLWLVVLAVAISTTPRVARVARGAAVEIVERDFVRSAEACGESRGRILLGEVLPNITSPLLVEATLRYTYTIALIAGLSFLGFGLQPPAADWGLMINENRAILTVQPWAVIVPAVCIAVFAIGSNLITEGYARSLAGIDRQERAR